jgi:transposase
LAHAVVDGLGRLIAFEVTPGQLGEVRVAGALLGPLPAARLCIADTAYDSNGQRQFIATRYDKLAANFAAAIAIATIVLW